MWCIIRSHEVRPQSSTFWLQWSFERLFSWRKELVQPCLQNTYHANQTDPQWKFLVSKATLRFFQTLSSLKCRLTSLLIHRASANVGVAGKLKGLSGKDSSDPSSAVSSTSHVTRRYVWSASTFCQCGLRLVVMTVWSFPTFTLRHRLWSPSRNHHSEEESQPVFMLCVIIAQWRQKPTRVPCAASLQGMFHSRDSSIQTYTWCFFRFCFVFFLPIPQCLWHQTASFQATGIIVVSNYSCSHY